MAAARKLPLLVVPGGTLNHFAHALGLETIADAAAAVRDGRVVAVDRAEIDGRTFLNTGSIGSYTDLVDAREKLESRIGKWPAMIVALVHVLRHSEPVPVELDGVATSVWMIFIGNCRYHPDGFGPSWREKLDDGILDIRIVHGHPWSRVRLLASVLTGTLGRCRVYEQRCVRRMHVRSLDGPLRLARDGETFDGSEEFDICKADEPLLVFVPQPRDGPCPRPGVRSAAGSTRPGATACASPSSPSPSPWWRCPSGCWWPRSGATAGWSTSTPPASTGCTSGCGARPGSWARSRR